MFVAGIDAHATYSVIAIVSNTGQLVAGPIRSRTRKRIDSMICSRSALWQVYFGPTTLGWFDEELFVIFDTHGNTGRNPIC